MSNLANRKIKYTYTYYSDSKPDEKIGIVTIIEGIFESTGQIEVINKHIDAIDLTLAEQYSNNLNGAIACLKDRAMPPNRCFFADYCKEIGVDPNNLHERLKISGGRNCSDDLYLTIEKEIIDE